ncbi:MAG: cell division protein FtsH, partial [Patescibacteria group bacterium]
QKNYSEAVAAQIDKEVRYFIDGAYKTAKKILGEKKEKLKEIAKRLVKQESIERDEFEAMVSPAV